MRAFRCAWDAACLAVAAVAVAVGGPVVGWWPLGGTAVVFGALGAAFAVALPEGHTSWPAVRRAALCSAAGGTVVAGLPGAAGSWSLLVLVSLTVTSPDLWPWCSRVVGTARQGQAGRPATRWDDRGLRRRWRTTGQAVQDRRRSPGELLLLVQERAELLAEIERRDPAWYADWLARTGWRQPQDGGRAR